MRINGELLHVLNPRRTRLAWGIFYVGLAAVVLGGLYDAADHIKTHTLAVGNVQLSTPYSTYVLGETISFSISNGYNAPIYFTNQCPTEPLAVYRQASGRWVRLHDQAPAKDCPDEERQVSIPASATVTSSLAPWQGLFSTVGKYRLVAIVNGYNSLPYVDLEIISIPPQPFRATPNAQAAPPLAAFSNLVEPQPQTQTTTDPSQPVMPPTVKPAATTYILHVNSSGNYDLVSLRLTGGDSIQIVYSKPQNNEVRTHFTPKAPTTGAIYATVDSEFTTRTVQFNAKGTWTFKADDYNGNTGILTVN